jgi:hypothetical protein
MILPSKHLGTDRALLFIGANLLRRLDHAKTVSQLWSEVAKRSRSTDHPPTFEWFVLALDLLYATGAVDVDRGLLIKNRR